MKKTLAWIVIGSLLTPGVTWAQKPAVVEVTPPLPEGWSSVACDYGQTNVPMTMETWAALTTEEQAQKCEAYKPTVVEPFSYKTGEPVSRRLAVVGLASAALGIVWLFPQGDTYHVLGSSYCVTDYSVDYGGCESPFAGHLKYPLAMIGVGALLMVIGLQSKTVTVKGNVSKSNKSIGVTLKVGR